MADTIKYCAECGAALLDGQDCIAHFHLMGFWELDYQLLEVHHLLVLSYYLQHPSLYSPQGLEIAKELLRQFLEEGIRPQEMRKLMANAVDSGKRNYKIKGAADSHASYARPITWTMRAVDVTAAGIEQYYERVRAWANSVLGSLKDSGNLDYQ